jgi:alpha-galactosidase
LQQHDQEAETFNKSQELWKELEGVLTDEGYTSNETLDKAVQALKGLREIGLQTLQGDVRSRFEEETRWVTSLNEDGS